MEGESRATIQRLIETGNVLVDGKQVRTSLKLRGSRSVDIPPPLPARHWRGDPAGGAV